MKKIFILFVFAALLFAACDVENPPNPGGQHQNAGEYKWHAEYHTISGVVDYYTDNDPNFTRGAYPEITLEQAEEAQGEILSGSVADAILTLDAQSTIQISSNSYSHDSTDKNEYEWRIRWMHSGGTFTDFFTHKEPLWMWSSSDSHNNVLLMRQVRFGQNRYVSIYLCAPGDEIIIQQQPQNGWN